MMADNVTPEERLFKVIRQVKGASTSAGVGALAAKPAGLSLKAASSLFQGVGIFFDEFSYEKINKILATVAVLLFLIVLCLVFTGRPSLTRLNNAVAGAGATHTVETTLDPLKTLGDYLGDVRRRDLFRRSAAVGGGAAGYLFSNIAKELSLSGIYLGQVPEAMIEDKAAKHTYFLTKGDSVRGDKVKSIQKDRVVLENNGQEVELI